MRMLSSSVPLVAWRSIVDPVHSRPAMRRRLVRRATAAAVVALAALHGAAAGASSLRFEGSLAFQFGLLDPVSVSGSGIAEVEDAGRQLTSFAIPAGAFAVEGLEFDLASLGLPPLGGLLATVANQAAVFARGGGALAGPMGIAGSAEICLEDLCSGAPAASLGLPLDAIGVGGTATAGSEGLLISITGAPWTSGQVEVGGVFASGFVFDDDPADVIGTVFRLVTPLSITTDLPGLESLSGFGFLTVQIVPEPGTLALLAGGLASLAAFGRARRA